MLYEKTSTSQLPEHSELQIRLCLRIIKISIILHKNQHHDPHQNCLSKTALMRSRNSFMEEYGKLSLIINVSSSYLGH